MSTSQASVLSSLCPCCLSGPKEDDQDDRGGRDANQGHKSQMDQTDLDQTGGTAAQCIVTKNKQRGESEYKRNSNASSSQQIPALCTDGEPGLMREASRNSGRARSAVSRYSIDESGSVRIDRTPSLSYCSEAGVAKSSSVLVNIPSSRGSMTSFGLWAVTAKSSPEHGRRGSLTASTTTEDKASSARQAVHRISVPNKTVLSTSPSWSPRTADSQERKCS